MPRRPTLWIGAVLALALLGIAAVAAGDERRVAFTLGVTPESEIVSASEEREVCQGPIYVSAPFEHVGYRLIVDPESAPRLLVEVRSLPDRRVLADGRIPAGYPPGERSVTARTGTVEAGQAVSVCLRADGAGRVGVMGGPIQASRTSSATAEGRTRDGDVTLVFLRERPRSALSLVPAMIDRAALWRPGVVSPALLGVLLVAVAIAVPFLLGRALRRVGTAADDQA